MSGSSTAAEHPPGLPSGTIRRLTTHYGPRVATWLRSAPDLVFRIATRYDLSFQGFHDAGWTSVVATATTRVDEQLVIIKAVPDARRFAREATVLTHWRGNGSGPAACSTPTGQTGSCSCRPSGRSAAPACPQITKPELRPSSHYYTHGPLLRTRTFRNWLAPSGSGSRRG